MGTWQEQVTEPDAVPVHPPRNDPFLMRLRRFVGAADMSEQVIRYIGVMAALALVIAFGWPLIAGRGDFLLSDFLLTIGLMAVAHLVRLRMTAFTAPINFGLGEAALIIGFTLVPPQWVPLAMGVGVVGARVFQHLFGTIRSLAETVRAAASLTVASAAAAAVVAISNIDTRPLNPSDSGVLAAAALLYLVSTAALLGSYLAVRDGHSTLQVTWGALRGSTVMIVGNLAIGLLAAALWQQRSPWLWVLPPLLWLLHQLYTHRLREDEERRAWSEFAVASRSLHQLDEVAVATEGVQSALSLFPVRSVELMVLGSQRRYIGNAGSSAIEIDEAPPAGRKPIPPSTVSRPLEVAGGPVGQLTLRLQRINSWGTVDQHRLAAFGDALAAALHDASTHSALRELRDRTTFESLHDPLTRLLNRDALLDRGDAVLRSLEPRRAVALLLLDLDNFKDVNDTLGHLAGDELLQTSSARLSEDVGSLELVARLGGDEFGLLLTDLPESRTPEDPSVDPLEAASVVALRRARLLAGRLATPTEVAGVMLSAEVSVGVVTASAGSLDMTELLRRADIALYQAKESGSRVSPYAAGADHASTDRLALVAELRAALEAGDQLTLLLQPTVELSTGAPSGVEALVRWHHPRRGLLTPVHFVRAAESSDLLGEFTRHVLDQALSLAADWAHQGLPLPIAVNLSPRSLLDPKLSVDVSRLLRKHGVPADRLVLEITETVVLSPLPVTDQVLSELRELGVRLSVDDFGTGFSSLTFLTRIAVDELKVDRTFVTKMVDSKQAAAIVRAVVDLGRQLGLRVVAEGVETADQRAALTALGCDAGQGFHFSRPLPADQIVQKLHALRQASRPVRALRSEAG